MLDIPDDTRSPRFKWVMRWNALGSLYFFEKKILQRGKLSPGLHKPILDTLEGDVLRFLFEMPRDHYKTTMVAEGRSIWSVLSFTEADEIGMRELGYDDSWIEWMKRAHNPARRRFLVSETITNAIKLGKRFDWHFRENDFMRLCFPDIMPDGKCVWNDESKMIKCAAHGPNGEGTFDFGGVGAALQSRHYTDVDEDDVVGKDAIESETVMAKVVDYHRLLIGAFESYATGHWTVTNNRWAPNDLSGWIRKNDTKDLWTKESHGALGGCCARHPAGVPIFPEEFTVEILDEIREIQGPYIFSHQYLNLPVSPEQCIFRPEWLHYYGPTKSPTDPKRNWLRHEVTNGETFPDIDPRLLIKSMIVDPNHAEERGRSRHAIVVTGFDPDKDRLYLLDLWARSSSADDLVVEMYRLAEMWGLPDYWLETIGAQRYLRYPIEYKGKSVGRHLTRRELKTERSDNAKRDRIDSLEPLFRNGQVWVRRDQREFLDEYTAYPDPSHTKDVLDALGYSLQTLNAIHAKRVLDKVRERRERWTARKSHTGY